MKAHKFVAEFGIEEAKRVLRGAPVVEEYLIDLNATQAAIRAGYSERTAKSIGQENLTKPDIQKAIEEAQNKRSERTEVTQDYVLENIKKVIERCMQAQPVENAFVQDDDGDFSQIYAFKEQGALKGLELLGKHLGMFKEKVIHAGDPDNPINHNLNITFE